MYLEALVLKDALDGRILAGRRQLGLEDDAKRPVPDDLALGILELLRLACHSVLDLFADHLCSGAHRR